MKQLCVEYGYTSLNHYGEELCGDNVEMTTDGDWTTLVLADGLGSGVKANILSTLTSKILCTMVAGGADMEDCVGTIIQTLPVCKERGVAYSTFSIIHVNNEGHGHLFEFDNPEAIWYHKGHTCDFPRTEMTIFDKRVYVTELQLDEGDMVFVMSDGTIHAGIGQMLNFGWQRKDIMEHLDNSIDAHMSARAAACLLASACNDLYLDRPGDDTTVAAIRMRPRTMVHVMVGPPVDKEKDEEYVHRFMMDTDKRIVCGGTTSQVVARCIGRKLKTSFDFPDKEVPPIGFIDGIDLVTEGVITLRRLLTLSDKYVSVKDLSPKTYAKKDGGSLLANIIFEEATHLVFFVGQNVNAAHQGLDIDITMKLKLVERLADNLRKMGKQVTINYD
ncbi:MAG: serine/threonine-protein phosphatase [Bacteroidales bacterium]|nr:serine/threonine-protein phosphatase [Bacteroidales bacterium]